MVLRSHSSFIVEALFTKFWGCLKSINSYSKLVINDGLKKEVRQIIIDLIKSTKEIISILNRVSFIGFFKIE